MSAECIPLGKDGLKFTEGDEFEAHGFKCRCGKDGPEDCRKCDGAVRINVFNVRTDRGRQLLLVMHDMLAFFCNIFEKP